MDRVKNTATGYKQIKVGVPPLVITRGHPDKKMCGPKDI